MFDKGAQVRISLRGQPAVDTGGVRRQFFSTVFEHLACCERYGLFDGPSDQLRPAFRMSNLSSGLMCILGVMVGHSLLMDGQGFPFFSECCYYYLSGAMDKAITLILYRLRFEWCSKKSCQTGTINV